MAEELHGSGQGAAEGGRDPGTTRNEVKELKLENEQLKKLVAELSVDNMVLKKSFL